METPGAEESACEVSSFQRNACKSGTWGGKSVLFREVLISGVHLY